MKPHQGFTHHCTFILEGRNRLCYQRMHGLVEKWVLPCFIFFDHRNHFKTLQVFKALAPDSLNVLRSKSAVRNIKHRVKEILMFHYIKESRWKFRDI